MKHNCFVLFTLLLLRVALIQISWQMELNKKRESEINKLRKDLLLSSDHFEVTESSLRKRHGEAINDLANQLEHLGKTKNRFVLSQSIKFSKKTK